MLQTYSIYSRPSKLLLISGRKLGVPVGRRRKIKGKSLCRMEKFYSLDLVSATKSVPSWPIFSAGVFVAVASSCRLISSLNLVSSPALPSDLSFSDVLEE